MNLLSNKQGAPVTTAKCVGEGKAGGCLINSLLFSKMMPDQANFCPNMAYCFKFFRVGEFAAPSCNCYATKSDNNEGKQRGRPGGKQNFAVYKLNHC